MLGDTLNQLNTVFNRNKYLLKENLKTSNFEINIENNVILILLEDSTMENIQEFKKKHNGLASVSFLPETNTLFTLSLHFSLSCINQDRFRFSLG